MRALCWLAAVGIGIIGCSLFSGSGHWFAYALEAQPPPADADAARLFDAQVAPILARHCLECHDSTSKKGKLDLSRREGAFKGGKGGPAIVPGNSAESPLWTAVESGEMPDDRPPLSAEEKQVLRRWIDAGAPWTGDVIDPSAHARDGRVTYEWVRRLTVPEYVETVRSAVGVDIEQDARRLLPRDVRADGFSNTAYNLNADLAHVEAYARLAEIIAGRVDVAKLAAGHAPGVALTYDAMPELIAQVGKWLLRGPLEEQEVESFLGVAKAVRDDGGDAAESLRYVVEAMLQSPRFVYRIENQRGDGTARRLNGYELASRLSYAIWGGPPDRELMRAADAGELADRVRVAAQVQRMLRDPRAVARSAQFLAEWLNLDRLDNLRPNPKQFPNWDERLAADMRAETLAFFKEVAWEQNRPLSDLLNAPVTFATPRLAAHYGLKRDYLAGASRDGLLALYTFAEGSGDTVRDTSGAGEPLHLKIEDVKAVAWGGGGLRVRAPVLIASAGAPRRLTEAVKKSRAMSIEAWVTPESAGQTGPARVVTLSDGPSQRNFTLGQDGDKYEARFRSTKTDANGLPGLASSGGSAGPHLTHVVYTRDAAGRAKLYVNGEERGARDVGGDLSNWEGGFRLALANETTKDRPWRGTFHTVALYGRALAPEEVRARGGGTSRYDLASVPGRRGLLTQGSVLTVGGDEASMVTRGLFLLKDFLYSGVGNPPPCADTRPVPTKPGQSQRVVAEARIANSACGGCHVKFEPLAFGLEKFDGLGAYHERDEHGNVLREDGEILFPGRDEPVAYKSTAELADLLAGSERVRMNITRKVTQFALGRPLVESDGPAIDRIHEAAWAGGGTYASLITAVVMSDLVQTTRTEESNR